MELGFYTIILCFSIFFSFQKKIIRKQLFARLWFSVYTLHILIIRNDFQSDILVYADSMSLTGFSFYFIREPIVWFSQRLLFNFIQSELLTFIICDLILGLILFRSLKNLNSPYYLYFAILCSFPFILGIQNIYRQFTAEIFMLYFLSISIKNKPSSIKKYSVFIIAILSHNVSGLFSPLVAIFEKRNKLLKIFISLVFTFLSIIIGRSSKSMASSGIAMEAAYLFVFLGIIIFLLLKDNLRIIQESFVNYSTLALLLIIGLIAFFTLFSIGSERVFIFILFLSFPIIAEKVEERFKQIPIVRILYTFFFFIPMFLSGIRVFII